MFFSVTFEHAKLKDHDTSELKCGVFTSTSRGNTCTVAAVAEDGDVVYQGDVCKDGEDLCRNFLAVRNKRSNKVFIIINNQFYNANFSQAYRFCLILHRYEFMKQALLCFHPVWLAISLTSLIHKTKNKPCTTYSMLLDQRKLSGWLTRRRAWKLMLILSKKNSRQLSMVCKGFIRSINEDDFLVLIFKFLYCFLVRYQNY